MGTIEFVGFPEDSLGGRAHPAVSRSVVRVPVDWLVTDAITAFADNLAKTWHVLVVAGQDAEDVVDLELYYTVRGNCRNDHERRAWQRLFGKSFKLPRSAFTREVLCECTETLQSKTCPLDESTGDFLLERALVTLRPSRDGRVSWDLLRRQTWYRKLLQGQPYSYEP